MAEDLTKLNEARQTSVKETHERLAQLSDRFERFAKQTIDDRGQTVAVLHSVLDPPCKESAKMR